MTQFGPLENREFVVASDEAQRDLAEWVTANLKKYHPDIPVRVIEISSTQTHPWFMKPQIMRQIAHKNTKQIWVDSDVEILGDLSPLFDMITPDKILIGEDRHLSQYYSYTMPNSGIFGIQGESPLLKAWSESAMREDRRGDQECLYAVCARWNRFDEIVWMPHKYHSQRLSPVEGALAHHWTGPAGKQHIRENLL